MRRMLITLLFSVVAKKSRTFSGLPCSANEQVCRSWEGAQPGSQPELPNGNIPYHRRQAQFVNGGLPGGRNPSSFFFFFPDFLGGSSNFSRSSVFLGISPNLQNPQVPGSRIAARGLVTQLVIGWWEENSKVYSLFCILTISSSSSSSISFMVFN